MSGLSPAARQQMELLDDQLADVRRRAADAERLSRDVDAVREVGVSAGREVCVEVDSLGRLVRLEFGPRAAALAPGDLADLVMDTLAAARVRASATVMGMVEAVFGAGSATAAALGETYRPVEPPATDAPASSLPRRGGPPLLHR